jgi:hypothetical protein
MTSPGRIGILAGYSQHFGLALSLGIKSKALTVPEKIDFEHWPLLFKLKESCLTNNSLKGKGSQKKRKIFLFGNLANTHIGMVTKKKLWLLSVERGKFWSDKFPFA